MMNRKAIFLDVDGTLTQPGHNVPPESAQRAVSLAREKGHLVFLCTGRSLVMTEPLLKYGFDGVIASAGGVVIADGTELFDCALHPDQLNRILDELDRNGIFRVLEGKDAVFADQKIHHSSQKLDNNSEAERWLLAMAAKMGVLPMEEYDGRPIYKVVFFYMLEEQLTTPRSLFEKDFEFCFHTVKHSDKWLNGEMINRNFSKGTAVRLICERFGVPLEDAIGFGDSMNDIAMIETVGTSVCMGNGMEELKEKCDIVCPSVEEDGLEKAFLQLGLI